VRVVEQSQYDGNPRPHSGTECILREGGCNSLLDCYCVSVYSLPCVCIFSVKSHDLIHVTGSSRGENILETREHG
jgi:hypothetical protein